MGFLRRSVEPQPELQELSPSQIDMRYKNALITGGVAVSGFIGGIGVFAFAELPGPIRTVGLVAAGLGAVGMHSNALDAEQLKPLVEAHKQAQAAE